MLKFLLWYEKFTDFLIDDHALTKNTDNDFDTECLITVAFCVIGMIFLSFLLHFNKPFVTLIAT